MCGSEIHTASSETVKPVAKEIRQWWQGSVVHCGKAGERESPILRSDATLRASSPRRRVPEVAVRGRADSKAGGEEDWRPSDRFPACHRLLTTIPLVPRVIQ